MQPKRSRGRRRKNNKKQSGQIRFSVKNFIFIEDIIKVHSLKRDESNTQNGQNGWRKKGKKKMRERKQRHGINFYHLLRSEPGWQPEQGNYKGHSKQRSRLISFKETNEHPWYFDSKIFYRFAQKSTHHDQLF